MLLGDHIIDPGGDIDGHVDINLFAGIKLSAKKVKAKAGMAGADGGIKV